MLVTMILGRKFINGFSTSHSQTILWQRLLKRKKMESAKQNYLNAYASMKDTEYYLSRNNRFNIEKFQEKYRRMKLQLNMKCEQLSKTRDELDALKLEHLDLKCTVDTANRMQKEFEGNLNIAMQNKQVLENNLKESFNARVKATRQLEDATAENVSLRQLLHISESEKCDLSRALEDYKSKNACHEMYKAELMKEHAKTKSSMFNLIAEMKRLSKDQQFLLSENKKIEEYKLVINSINFYKEELEKVRTEKNEVEEKLIYYRGKYDQLEKLINDLEIMAPTKETEFFYNEWKNSVRISKEQAETNQTIIANLMEQLRIEKESNGKLIEKQSEYEREIDELNKKIPQRDFIETMLEIVEIKSED